jgi:hypothetical protein
VHKRSTIDSTFSQEAAAGVEALAAIREETPPADANGTLEQAWDTLRRLQLALEDGFEPEMGARDAGRQ